MIEIEGLRIESGEQVAIVGDNASGKSRLTDAIASRSAADVAYIRFRDTYGASLDREYFHQQRWNHGVWDDDMPSVRQLLGLPCEAAERLVRAFSLEGVLDKPLITLSSGEMRKYQLIRALKRSPSVLLMDNPYIGLDPLTREMLTLLLRDLVSSEGLSVVMVLSRPEEIPSFITHVVEVKSPQEWTKQTAGEYRETHFPEEVIRFCDVSVRYGDRTILSHLDWTVRRGEHWALTGPNGCGKSTLLSLVCADNPMAYACHIELFGRKRGSGESIWDIKKKIGYVSPEMHRAYRTSETVQDVVVSGLFDTTGVPHNPSPEQLQVCREWMEKFGLETLSQRPFAELSSGEQRLCLVCRAFVKEPPLLILDEPMHGLDNALRFRVRRVIDDYCADPSKTLIMVTHYPEEYPSCIDHSLTLTRK